ncbi:hypothetical protein ES703_41911 [subsurface metagenome]
MASSCKLSAIFPISVFIPVPITIPSPFPLVITVFIYPRFVLSARIIFSSTGFSCFLTGFDSPVKIASSTESENSLKSRISAGNLSPSPIKIMSPGTTSSTAISITLPPLLTLAK